MQKVKYLIIGGGISGLSFAYKKSTEDYIVLEKENVLGGLCKSFYQKEFVWDVSGHFFHFNSEETKDFFDEINGSEDFIAVKKCAKAYYKGKYIDAPFQYNIDKLPKEDFLECLKDLYFTEGVDNKDNFYDYVISKYGQGISKKFLIPYNEKLYACSLNKLEADSMGEYFPKLTFDSYMKQLRGVKKETYNDVFLYLKKGCMDFIESLSSKLQKERIHLNEMVLEIDLEKKIVRTNKYEYEYEYLINTAPMNVFCNMANIKENIKIFQYNKVLVFNLGFDKESIDKEITWAYYSGDEIFYRVGFYNNITKTDKLSIYVEIGVDQNTDVEPEKLLDSVLEDLKKVGIINNHKLIEYNHYIINPGYVHLTKEVRKYSKDLMEILKEKNVYMIGRYAKWEYSAMDTSIEQAIELSNMI